MKPVYLMYKHKLAAGNGKKYAQVAKESFKWFDQLIEDGLVKNAKTFSPIFGNDEFVTYMEFETLDDAHNYVKLFDESGLKAKYRDLMSYNETVIYEEVDELQTNRFFDVISEL